MLIVKSPENLLPDKRYDVRGKVGVVVLSVQIVDGPVCVLGLVAGVGAGRGIALGKSLREPRDHAIVTTSARDKVFAVPFRSWQRDFKENRGLREIVNTPQDLAIFGNRARLGHDGCGGDRGVLQG